MEGSVPKSMASAGAKRRSRPEYDRIRRAINYLDSTAADISGLFTTPALPSDIAAAQELFEKSDSRGRQLTTGAAGRKVNPHAVAYLLLAYLEDLDDPLLTSKLHDAFNAAIKIKDFRSRLYVLRLLLDRLPASNASLLELLMGFLSKLVSADSNTAHPSSLQTLARVFGPPLLCRSRSNQQCVLHDGDSSSKESGNMSNLIATLITECGYLLLKKSVIHGQYAPGGIAGLHQAIDESVVDASTNSSDAMLGVCQEEDLVVDCAEHQPLGYPAFSVVCFLFFVVVVVCFFISLTAETTVL
eukprot:jgi/Mesvir1/14875/Mv05485-RA.2